MTDFEQDPIIEAIAREARRPVAPSSDARSRLLQMIGAEPVPVRTRWPLSLGGAGTAATWATAAGLVGIGVLAGMGIQLGRDSRVTGQPQVAAASSSQLPASDTVVTFVFAAPAAAQVSVVGDFNQWSAAATPMVRIGNSDVWTVTVPMAAGRHVYSFVAVGADGERWSADPRAPAAPDDGFGRANSVVLVGKGSAS